jgi:spermidine/putrescine-binding protein
MIFALVLLVACDNRPKLYVLNWEQYINHDVVKAFEQEYNVNVVLRDTTSNESMYNKVLTRAEKYDIVIPSDYMIQRMYEEDLLIPLDFTKIPNYQANIFDEKLQEVRDNYFTGNQDYAVPYFWGTLGIMYNKNKSGVKNLVETNGWSVFFERNLVPANVSVGMYDSSRDAVAAAELYRGYDLNTTDEEKLNDVENLLKNNFFSQWGTDNLKEAIAEQNLDIALVYSGDYFDQLFLALESGVNPTFDLYVPRDRNNIWFDAMVIPTTSTQTELAHAFINFFLDFDNALENAAYVGYCPTISAVYEALQEDEELADAVLHPGYYPGVIEQYYVYRNLGEEVANRMDLILTRAKIK